MCNKNFNKKGVRPPLKWLMIGSLILAITLLMGGVVMFLWNMILPEVANVKPLNYWQAVGLLVLFKILFGGLGKRHHRKHRKHWKEKWMNMDDQERMEFKNKWKDYCNRKKK